MYEVQYNVLKNDVTNKKLGSHDIVRTVPSLIYLFMDVMTDCAPARALDLRVIKR